MCIFCKIVNQEIPNYTVYEDEHVLAFLDISQITKGHTLVIPKKHYDNFLACDAVDVKRVMEVTHTLSIKLKNILQCEGMNILTNVNEVAGQSVFHFHVHIIPRYSDKDACVITFNESEKQDLAQLCKQLTK